MRLRLPDSVRLNLLLVVLAGVLPMTAVVLLAGWERRGLELDHAAQATAILAEYYAAQQENETLRIKTVLARLATLPEVRSLSAGEATPILRQALAVNPSYVNFALLDVAGNAVASALPFTSQNLSNRREFVDATRTGDFAVGEYAVGRVSGVQVLPFAQPVQGEAGYLLGVLIATLRLQDLAPAFEKAMLPEQSFVGLTDAKGLRLYRFPASEQMPLGVPIALNIWERIRGMGRDANFLDAGTGGRRFVYALRRLSLKPGQEPYLNLFVGVPEESLFTRADAVTRTYLAWLALSLLLSGSLAWLVARYGIHQRVARLVQVAGRLGAGEYSARSGLTESQGALGRLAGSLDHMAQALERDAAERLQSQQALEAEIHRRKALLDLSCDGIIVVDDRLNLVEANARFASMLSYARGEVQGAPLERFEAGLDQEAIRRTFDAVQGGRAVFETVFRRRDGALLDMEVSASGATVEGQRLVLAVIRDVSERKQAQAALRESEERYALALRGANDGVWDLDLRTGRVYFSARWKEIVGLAGHERDEMDLWRARIHPDDLERVQQALEGCARGETSSFEIEHRLRHQDGSWRWVLGRGASLRDGSGLVIRMAGALTDVSERRRMMELMLQTEKMMSVGGLAAGMAHEINNPLGGIIQSVQVLQARLGKDTPTNRSAASEAGGSLESVHGFCARRQVPELLGSIGESAVRATRIVQDMLDFCRQGADPSPGDVAAVLDQALALCAKDYDLKKRYDFRHIRIERDYEPGLPPAACVEGQLAQVFMNILRNAAQAMSDGQPEGRVPSIVLRTRSEPGGVRVEIEDNGPGMAEAVRRKVFEPFFTTKPPGVGTGLGLSVSYFIVSTNHGGTLEVESAPGAGSRFIVRLPWFDSSRHVTVQDRTF
ncbi:Sporulation kinase A [Fundidesulfovibrio magnetotacticus]|uniref:histidine kinase n=1 Tax=Fundidesulfovibrio magnetotacticus TaxID=2730080 RepID=A0A6V8M0N0_9BACT|nr:PAS domain S-box protein [Fundidesulfovibrio magnetotacticus]GFK95417.1 Sporulation kinase A [Fundidesulfovibrio magnetotacticus]